MAYSVAALFAVAATTLFVSPVLAAPATKVETRQSITTLSSAQISAFEPYTHFASTAYCNPSETLTWTCGPNCDANSDFIPVASGGDGALVQFWYVGFSPSLQTVVVAHQGTDTDKIIPLLTDLAFIPAPLNPTLFPGISSKILVHSGFMASHAAAAMPVLNAVKTAISLHNANKVTITGHSLGGAIALLDAVFLPLHVSGVTFKLVTYGQPRVGNPAFADYVDQHITDFNHVNNQEDPVPTLPPRLLGFSHASGELHIEDNLSWAVCPGHDNTAKQCSGNIFVSEDFGDHSGPYAGITMGC